MTGQCDEGKVGKIIRGHERRTLMKSEYWIKIEGFVELK